MLLCNNNAVDMLHFDKSYSAALDFKKVSISFFEVIKMKNETDVS